MAQRAEVIAKIKERLGSLSDAVTDDLIDDSIDAALDDLSRLLPKRSYQIFTLVPEQELYEMPDNTYNVLDVVFPSPRSMQETDLFSKFAHLGDGDLSTFNSHSLAVVIAQKWEQFENRYGIDWEYNIDTNKVMVMPPPQMTSKMLVELALVREIEDIPNRLERVLQDLTLSDTLSYIATSMSGGVSSIPIGIGNVSFNTKDIETKASTIRESALKKLGTGGGAVVIG